MEPVFVNGLRKTDADTMEIAEMVLNKVNKSLVTLVEELGVQAVGVSGKDGGLLKVKKKYSNGEDIGFVGEITDVNPKFFMTCSRRIFFQSCVQSVLMTNTIHTISMQMMQHVLSPEQFQQKSLHSSQISRVYTRTLQIRIHLFQSSQSQMQRSL